MQNNTFSTLFVGQNLIKLSAVDSTNNYLKKLTSNSEPLPEGTVIMAEHQFAGRGQLDNVWHAAPGKNLTFSLLLRPNFLAVEKQFALNMLVSVALSNVLLKYLPVGLSVKWPNDIYVGDKKIGGVLIENILVGSKIKQSIIGIGLNINQSDFADDLNDRITSISQILQQDVNLMVLLNEICTQIEQLYLKMKAGTGTTLQDLYVSKLYRLNKLAKYSAKGQIFEGTIEGISPEGLLRIKPLDGHIVEFGFKEVAFIQQQ
ncbi:biotin--[acetyl-CoA-carboxylase] ligase [Pedobacter xixiisoli]|uniref:BirA family transcriptional regulator, biotin operon repressor / biotin-[acetyl-CoA-carboxylase] ligase n=1 Tax=Pedobacter xixiisoli TaxID=1476464 RepID=A0A286AEB0_9SPHI|nr:biotin--[acetyl-CoA-carboxylase] ligase [Pedobacter xixiisoli]SOD20242.1 BirA family transcriptional regulator, biotin operon repressor / biotin-[acetyl-CoA-carboxylase] ligase [Pedobacter xixiisoli]